MYGNISNFSLWLFQEYQANLTSNQPRRNLTGGKYQQIKRENNILVIKACLFCTNIMNIQIYDICLQKLMFTLLRSEAHIFVYF